MRRAFAVVMALLCALLLVPLVGCDIMPAEKSSSKTESEGEPARKAAYTQEVGKEESTSIEYELTNSTSFQITAMSIEPVYQAKEKRTAEAAEWARVKKAYPNNSEIQEDTSHDDLSAPKNLMDDKQTISNREVFVLHYLPTSYDANTSSNSSSGSSDSYGSTEGIQDYEKTQAELQADADGRTLYEIDLTTPEGVLIISDVDFADFTVAELCCESGIGYLNYVSNASGDTVSTRDAAMQEGRMMVTTEVSHYGTTEITTHDSNYYNDNPTGSPGEEYESDDESDEYSDDDSEEGEGEDDSDGESEDGEAEGDGTEEEDGFSEDEGTDEGVDGGVDEGTDEDVDAEQPEEGQEQVEQLRHVDMMPS